MLLTISNIVVPGVATLTNKQKRNKRKLNVETSLFWRNIIPSTYLMYYLNKECVCVCVCAPKWWGLRESNRDKATKKM